MLDATAQTDLSTPVASPVRVDPLVIERLNGWAEISPDVIYRLALHPAPHIEFLSDSVEAICGYPASAFLADCTLIERLVATEDREHMDLDKVAAALYRPEDLPAESLVRWCHRDGQIIWTEMRNAAVVDEDGRLVAIEGSARDITARKLAEQALAVDEVELRHRQKLEAVGLLAAGIAHEINTPMQFVGDNVQFLGDSFTRLVDLLGKYRSALSPEAGGMTWAERQRFLSEAEIEAETDYLQAEIPRAVEGALDGATRVASIVRAMKAFGHPDGVEERVVDLNESLRNTIIVARHEYRYVADVVTDLGELPLVMCHGGDVNQAMLNLLVNAAHAIEDGNEGTERRGIITVRSRLDGDMAAIEIRDTGPGIPEEIQSRVFDPFFTTKEVGRGTGQGLALVRAVVERHHGSVAFSTSGEGTTFMVRIPVDGSPGTGRQP